MGGSHRVPGDKSITHRALMLAAVTPGVSTIRGALTSDDARSTARILRQLGASISPLRSGATVRIVGPRRLRGADATLDCGNSGTTARLMLGVLAAQKFEAQMTGDQSLRGRPMRRVTEPLSHMGARIRGDEPDRLPLTIRGGSLADLEWQLPVASAQIKSALLLAGALGGAKVVLHEPDASRDHTERMLQHFGFTVTSRPGLVTLEPTGNFSPFEIDVPGDPSSAIFLLAAAALAERGSIAVEQVGINPSRTGFLSVLERFGVAIAVSPADVKFGEPRGTLSASASNLRATDISASEVAGVIDEIPMLACLAARANGTSRFLGLAELRVKESDRLALLGSNLRSVGVDASIDGDDLVITGTDAPLKGRVVTGGDHRIAMAFTVLGRVSGSRIAVDDLDCASVSFPKFAETLAGLYTS